MSTSPFSEFRVGTDDFESLWINQTASGNFCYFSRKREPGYVKYFVLADYKKTKLLCHVTLIKKGEKFTPRLEFSIRDPQDRIERISSPDENGIPAIKARVDLKECHENFWSLISYLQSLREQIDIPPGRFSLVSSDEADIVAELRKRHPASLKSIIKQLSSTRGLLLSHEDINELLNRKETLAQFERELRCGKRESWWQDFFDKNKWIFGYGLNYHILRSQPDYGGADITGSGGHRGDYLASSLGDLSFTVLVEIKTPDTPLLHGEKEVRSGAWSLSRGLSDALTQIQANLHQWETQGAQNPRNLDMLEAKDVYTVRPRGIIVIGSLSELGTERSKRETVERFRKSVHGVEIVTFDELHRRAKFIVENKP